MIQDWLKEADAKLMRINLKRNEIHEEGEVQLSGSKGSDQS